VPVQDLSLGGTPTVSVTSCDVEVPPRSARLTAQWTRAFTEEVSETKGASRRPGLPPTGPIRLLPPQLVEMTLAQGRLAIQSLAVLLRSWLEGGPGPRRG
jgi:hypothetical protein